MEVLDHKCPGCGAKLPFNPETQKWDCGYCGGSYTLDELTEFEAKQNKEDNSNDTVNADMYECPNCGAKIIADENTTATFCVYCGSTSIIKNKLKGEFRPHKLIPFKNTKEDAIEAFKKFKRGKIFAPKDFSKKENIEKITGVYIPFWLYDFSCEGEIECHAINKKYWSSGNYDYTKTDTYRVERAGQMQFEKVPTDASTKFDDDTMDSIEPFDYKDLVDFNMSYLSGFLSEKYDVNEEKAYERANYRVENSVEALLKSTTVKYDSISVLKKNVNVLDKKSEYVLLPVWMLNIKYNDNNYLFAMNGQTGRMVGNIPIDKRKRALYTALFFVASLLVITLVILIYVLLGM